MENLDELFKERLVNMLFRRGDDNVFELANEVISGIEGEFSVILTDEELKRLDNITENYLELFE